MTNQVDLSSTKAALDRLGLSFDRTHWVADRFGYTGSASVFMALFDAVENAMLESGDLVALCTSGAGFTTASALFRWV